MTIHKDLSGTTLGQNSFTLHDELIFRLLALMMICLGGFFSIIITGYKSVISFDYDKVSIFAISLQILGFLSSVLGIISFYLNRLIK